MDWQSGKQSDFFIHLRKQFCMQGVQQQIIKICLIHNLNIIFGKDHQNVMLQFNVNLSKDVLS